MTMPPSSDPADRASEAPADEGAGASAGDRGEGSDETSHHEAPGIQPDPAIAVYVAGIERVTTDVRALVIELNDAQLNWRPSDGHWSIAECIAHLTATGAAYAPPISRAIDRGFAKRLYGGRDFHPNALGRWVIAQAEPPPRRRLLAARRLVPQRVEGAGELLAGFEVMQRILIEQIRMTAGLDLSRIRLGSPVIPIIRLPLGTWFGYLVAHERRHLWQARQVRQELRFPG